jgi:hypothetical protein
VGSFTFQSRIFLMPQSDFFESHEASASMFELGTPISVRPPVMSRQSLKFSYLANRFEGETHVDRQAFGLVNGPNEYLRFDPLANLLGGRILHARDRRLHESHQA